MLKFLQVQIVNIFQHFLLQTLKTDAIIQGAGLDTQQDWRTRHPQVVTYKDNCETHLPYICVLRGYIQLHYALYAVFGGMDREPKETPPMRPVLVAQSCGYPIRLGLFKSRTLKMLFTFLIAYRDQKIAQLARIRTISAIANSEAAARAQLPGLPLVFVSCATTKGGAL